MARHEKEIHGQGAALAFPRYWGGHRDPPPPPTRFPDRAHTCAALGCMLTPGQLALAGSELSAIQPKRQEEHASEILVPIYLEIRCPVVSTLWKMTVNRNLVKKAAAQPEELRHSFHPKANDGPELILSAQTAPVQMSEVGALTTIKQGGRTESDR